MNNGNTTHPIEDRVFKSASLFFGQELLPQLGIEGKILRIAPTEQTHLEIKDFNQDFNFEMDDGTWKHFEFESDKITDHDLSRFREYEATASYCYDVEITTYVICTSNAPMLKDELHSGINQYRVIIIRMKDEEAERYITCLDKKIRTEQLTREELVKLILTPVMGGDMEMKERINRSLNLLQSSQNNMDMNDYYRMISMLYAFAHKFLKHDELEDCKGRFHMTELGKLLMRDGEIKGIQAMILDNLESSYTKEQILAKLIRFFTLTPEEAENYFNQFAK